MSAGSWGSVMGGNMKLAFISSYIRVFPVFQQLYQKLLRKWKFDAPIITLAHLLVNPSTVNNAKKEPRTKSYAPRLRLIVSPSGRVQALLIEGPNVGREAIAHFAAFVMTPRSVCHSYNAVIIRWTRINNSGIWNFYLLRDVSDGINAAL